MKKIKLRGKYNHLSVLVDDADFEKLSGFRAYKHSKGYASIYIEGKHLLIHRYLMEPGEGMDVDHINGNKLDNQRSNLRVCTRGINVQNQKGWAKSGFKGVNRNGKYWQANIYHSKKRYFLGNFKTIEEAVVAYNAAASDKYGTYAKING